MMKKTESRNFVRLSLKIYDFRVNTDSTKNEFMPVRDLVVQAELTVSGGH